MQYLIESKAYTTAVLHAVKHESVQVNGVLIGHVDSSSAHTTIVDAVPLFHGSLGLAPLLEVAMMQVEKYCQGQGYSIVGYYHANELKQDKSIGDVAKTIADKIHELYPHSCFLLMDNEHLRPDVCVDSPAFLIYTKPKDGWKLDERGLRWKQDMHDVLSRVSKYMVDDQRYENVFDFDEHLDDPHLDWFNRHVQRD